MVDVELLASTEFVGALLSGGLKLDPGQMLRHIVAIHPNMPPLQKGTRLVVSKIS